MGYADTPQRYGAGGVRRRTTPTAPTVNRKILDHLLHDAFPDDAETEPEIDLVLDPDPPPETIDAGAGPLSVPRRAGGLRQPDVAGDARSIPFLSTRRCRHLPGVDRPAAAGGDRRARPTPTPRSST